MLQILGSLGGLNVSHTSKIETFKIDSINYGLLLYSIDICRISFFKLNINESNFGDLNGAELLDPGTEKYEFILLRVFIFSFSLLQVICTDCNIWVVGPKAVADLKPYIESVLKEVKSVDDECMDVDDDGDADEFRPEMFSITVKVPKFEKYDFHERDIFVACKFLESGFILCHKLTNLRRWELVLLNGGTTQPCDMNVTSFLDFPITNRKIAGTASFQDNTGLCNPVIIFVHYNDPDRLIFESLFGVKISLSHAVCIVSHADGNILWYLCDGNKKFHSSVKSQILSDVGQPVIAMYFVRDIEEQKGSDCMLIVGALGQITLISSKKHTSSSSLVNGSHPFWITTVHLKSSIKACVIVKESLLYFSSDGKLWITNVSKLFNCDQSEDICLASNCSKLSSINQMAIVDKNKGLLLLSTFSGNLYLTLCKKEMECEVISSSLPDLMNECLTQSTSMQGLLKKKALQSRLFAAISTFASLKFSENVLKEPITFSLSEINLQPKKYILVINLKCFEHLQLDPEICFVSASVFTYVEGNNSLVSKTIAYDPDEPTLCLELTDSILQPPFESIFPLLVEIGLILQLPDKWKVMDCFKTVSQCLPFYLRIQTFMVHELHLYHSNALCSPPSSKVRKPKTYEIIKELQMRRPISNVLLAKSRDIYDFPLKFNLCLSASSVELLMKNSNALDTVAFVKHLLFGNKDVDNATKGISKTSKFCPISVAAAKNDSAIVITISADTFDSLIMLRLAVMDVILSCFNRSKCSLNSSAFVNIPATIYRRCEEISKSLMALYGSDIESEAVTYSLLQLYEELRTDVSGKLPIL